MRTIALLVFVALSSVPVLAGGPGAAEPSSAAAVSADEAVAAATIASLRSRGPAGLELLLGAYASEIDVVRNGGAPPANWERIRRALDGVALQRDAYASGLYWYDDLDEALAVARSTGRPVLSLRLLGRLDEEYSCANSRYFRSALYANATVAEYLRRNVVLHWSTERPAPRITIDFGDGRTLVRTITGNSAHYVLDARGRVVDVLPGLYGPGAFVRTLGTALDQARTVGTLETAEWHIAQQRYAASQIESAGEEWASAIRALRKQRYVHAPAPRREPAAQPPVVTAVKAGEVAMTKRISEIPLLRALDLETAPHLRFFDDEVWEAVAALSPDDARLDDAGRAMVARHVPAGTSADDLAGIAASFESAVARDSVRARFAIRPMTLARLTDMWRATPSEDSFKLDAANRLVYDSIFLTPSSDPWLGLYPASVYTALENGGVSKRD